MAFLAFRKITCCSTIHQAGLRRMELKIFLLLLLFKGLDGLCIESTKNQIQSKFDKSMEKVLFSPIIIKGRIKSKLETKDFLEVNIRVLKIYKGKQKFKFIRLIFDKCLWYNYFTVKLGANFIFYLSEKWRPLEMPDVFSRKLKRTVTKYGCTKCSKYSVQFVVAKYNFQF